MADRDRAVEILQRAWVVDCLSIETFEFRVAQALAARSQEELRAVLRDLPARQSRTSELCMSVVLDIAERKILLGRHRTCDRVLCDETISRRHALVRRTTAGLVLRDLDSTNGTWVNGRRVTGPTTIRPCDEVALGRLCVTIVDSARAGSS